MQNWRSKLKARLETMAEAVEVGPLERSQRRIIALEARVSALELAAKPKGQERE